jgi:hypothetical protein
VLTCAFAGRPRAFREGIGTSLQSSDLGGHGGRHGGGRGDIPHACDATPLWSGWVSKGRPLRDMILGAVAPNLPQGTLRSRRPAIRQRHATTASKAPRAEGAGT